MNNLEKAIELESKSYYDELNYEELLEIIKPLGFKNLKSYLAKKRDYLFQSWAPEVHYIPTEKLSQILYINSLIHNPGIYIPSDNEVKLFNANTEINKDTCETLELPVIEMYYTGATTLTSSKDLSMFVVSPHIMNLSQDYYEEKLKEIFSHYNLEITIEDGKIKLGDKAIGYLTIHSIMNANIQFIHINFTNYNILSNKVGIETLEYLEESIVSKEQLEKEILNWLRKEDN
jgi:hypothetical protein